ncbi:MAG: hypothetical protein R8M46_02875 [Ghiorsea sp.]
MSILKRRDFDLGLAPNLARPTMPDANLIKQAWLDDKTVMLPALLHADLETHAENIKNAHLLMENVLNESEITPFIEKEPYISAYGKDFSIVATSAEEHDEQGIEKIYFDAYENDEDNVIAEELWCKGSWLSFIDDDASLRFRFSWGMEGYEDVSSDPLKQEWAGKLCDALFPESVIITKNVIIAEHLKNILGKDASFVERIVYFNAPNGGAQMHHDVERGHAGVVFAQLSGSTFWLSLAKPKLMAELTTFMADKANQKAIKAVLPKESDRKELSTLCQNHEDLSCYMEEPDHELVEAVVDRCPAFTQHLITQGYSHTLLAGDVLLLPQRDLDNCVWHSVFTLGDNPGEALSFAVR